MTKNKAIYNGLIAIGMGILLSSLSCKSEQEFFLEGTPRNIEGAWRISKAARNGADLTPFFHFNDFRLHILPGNAYEIENPLPFLVSKDGTWTFDDPTFPSKISFTEEGSTAPATSAFLYPIVGGRRMISISFSPGCSANTYEYTLERITE